MDKTQFRSLVTKIQSNYTSCTGAVAQMRGVNRHYPVSICVSSFRNNNEFVPTECIVWDDNKILFEGKLTSGYLRRKLSCRELCCAEITSADEIELNTPGEFMCFGDPEKCKDRYCKYKTIQLKKEQEKEKEAEDEMLKRGDYLLKAVWKSSMKKARKEIKSAISDSL